MELENLAAQCTVSGYISHFSGLKFKLKIFLIFARVSKLLLLKVLKQCGSGIPYSLACSPGYSLPHVPFYLELESIVTNVVPVSPLLFSLPSF